MTRLANRFSCVLAAGTALIIARASPAQSRSCQAPVPDSTPAAQWAAPLDRPITVHATELSLRNALDRVAAISKLRLSYSAEALPLDRAVCLSADAEPVGQVLRDLLAGVSVAAVAVGNDQIVLTPRATTATHQASPQSSRAPELLDRVVVTGSAIGAPERELTVGVDVVNGHQLSRQNTTTLSSALDGFVPGVWSWAQSPSAMVTSYASIRGASSFGLSYPKIYIDGIEVANPLLVTRFAPETIDHIEVIRGPQGSALYGTDAISGVVNIVTRHEGTDSEGQHASIRSSAGLTQSNFAHNVIAQEHALSIVSGSNTQSFDFNIAGGSTGDFVPNGYSRDLLASASARIVGARTTLSTTARFFTEQAGATTSPLLTPVAALPNNQPGQMGMSSQRSPETTPSTSAPQSIHEYTLGSTLTLAQSERWTHTLVAGIDGYRLANVETSFTAIPSAADSALRAAQGGADRATLRASSVLQINGADPTRATMTFSAEHAVLRESSQLAEPPSPSNGRTLLPQQATTYSTTYSNVTSWQTSTGLTAQANGIVGDRFFVTAGARVEQDSRLSSADQLSVLPMLGAAAVNDFGPLTVKLRAAYGEGIRPPATTTHADFWQARTQPSLGAERQSGTEAGLDVIFRRLLSVKITRFDQRASGLIQQVAVPLDSNYQSRRITYALENVGEISNRGWELEGQTNFSRLALTGTWSSVDSRVTKLATGYTGDLMTGDRMLQVPSSTGSVNVAWVGDRWHLSLASSRAFDWINYDEIALGQAYMSGEHPARDLLGQQLRQYWRRYTGGTRLRTSASRDIRDGLAFEISADNLLNYQVNEPDNITVVPGRTVMTGVRLKF